MNLASNIGNNDSPYEDQIRIVTRNDRNSYEERILAMPSDLTATLVDENERPMLTGQGIYVASGWRSEADELARENESLREQIASMRAEYSGRISNLEGLVNYLRDRIERGN